MKIYIAGKITGNPNYKEQFDWADRILRGKGNVVMNPATLPEGFEHNEYMHVCYSMIDVCEAIALLPKWEDSKGAKMEREYAVSKGKQILLI